MSPPLPPQRPNRPRLQIVATHGRVPVAIVGDGVQTRGEVRVAHKTGPSPVSDIRLLYGNYYLTPTGNIGQETVAPNVVQQETALETVTPAAYYVGTFGAQQRPTFDVGVGHVLTDPFGVDVPANTVIYSRTGTIITAGGTFLGGITLPGLGDEGYARSAAASSQIYGTGTITVPSGGVFASAPWPLAVLGVPQVPFPSIFVVGDSIAHGSGDSATTEGLLSGGALGYVARGLQSVNGAGLMVPWAMAACPGMGLSMIMQENAYRRLSIAQYASHALCQLGNNNGATALATTKDYFTKVWTALKRRGCHVTQVLWTPRTTDATNTAIATNYGVGENRDLVNAWIRTQVGNGILDAIVDPNVYLEHSTNHGFWLDASLTSDGTHPSTAGAIAAAPAIQAWAQTLRVSPLTGRAI